MTEADVKALGREMTERLREMACICPKPGCHFCAPAEVYWPTFRAAIRSMTSVAAAEFLRAERIRRMEVDERTRARRRNYAHRRAALVRVDGWDTTGAGRRATPAAAFAAS